MDKTVIMPETLTAENGAKGALIGEFFESIQLDCPECKEYDDPDPDCEICHGTGGYVGQVAVSWTTIKNIYRMAVKVCGKPVGAI